MAEPTPSDIELGLDCTITRRDFLNATLLGAGAALLGARTPFQIQAPQAGAEWDGFGGVGDYARSHGNTWEVVQVGHQLRDGKFDGQIASAVDTGETYDLVVVGGGMSGLGAAHFFQKGPGGKCLILDNHPVWGGEAKRNEFNVEGTHLIGPQGSNDFGMRPAAGWTADMWKDLGLPVGDEFQYQSWAPGIEPLEISRDNYYFQLWGDEFASHAYFIPGANGLQPVKNPFANGMEGLPWPENVKRDFVRWRTETKRYYEAADFDRWLDTMTYDTYLTNVMGLDPAIARYADPVLAGAIGLGSDVLSAYAAYQIGLPGTTVYSSTRSSSHKLSDYPNTGSFPGGNDGIARHFLKKLIPSAIAGGNNFADVLNGKADFAALDRSGQPTRIRVGSTVIRVEQPAGKSPVVTYVNGGKLHKVSGRGVVMANGGWSTQHVVADLPAAYRTAYAEFIRAPMLVVNVALRRWRFMYDQGITAASYRDKFGFCCNVKRPMIAGDYQPPLHPDKPIVLTFYVPFSKPGMSLKDQATAGRNEILGTSYRDYERQIREQLVRLFGRFGFDPRRDVAGIILNRWGHAYVCPSPGFYFGRNGQPGAPAVIRQALGKVSFANADLHGHQNWRDAVAEGKRAAEQVWG